MNILERRSLGNTLGMVPGRCGDNAALALLVTEQGDAMSGAAYLEAPRVLQVLGFEPDALGAWKSLRQREERSIENSSLLVFPGALNVGQCDHARSRVGMASPCCRAAASASS